jgi:SAM-dependent methyltransferase
MRGLNIRFLFAYWPILLQPARFCQFGGMAASLFALRWPHEFAPAPNFLLVPFAITPSQQYARASQEGALARVARVQNMPVPLEFTAHNIRLDNGQLTRPGDTALLADDAWTVSAKRVLRLAYSNGISGKKLVDLGCLEGGFTAEFARMGFSALGIEVRRTNFACCRYVKENLALPNLDFAQDTVWNLGKYGGFDAVFCCGLLYHLDRPRDFLKQIAGTGASVVILNTHYAPEVMSGENKFNLSEMQTHEGLPGR